MEPFGCKRREGLLNKFLVYFLMNTKSNDRNVLNIITSILDGGLERHVFYILSNKSEQRLKHRVIVLAGRRENSLTQRYESLGIEIKYFDFDTRFSSIKSFFINIKMIFQIAAYMRSSSIDVVHSHDFFPAFIARVSAIVSFVFCFHRVKRIYVTLHIVFFWLKRIHHLMNRALGLITTKVICLSNAILQYSLKSDKLPVKKYQIIYTGIDTSKFVPNNELRGKYIREFGLNESDIVLGNIGVLSVRKGQIYLLEAVNSLKNKFPNIRMLIFGSERTHELEIKKELIDFIRFNELESIVKIIEPRDDINSIYNVFDIFVMPSITEGLSACAIEALFMRRLCLFSDIEPFKELVEDGLNGYLFRNKDTKDLEKKLDYLLSNIDNLDMVKENAAKSVDSRFDIKTMVSSYERLYVS